MANQVFNSIDNYFAKNDLKNIPSRSAFDLSYIHSFDTCFGALVPFYLEDCLPNDDFTIKEVIKVQALPFLCPVFTTFKIRTYYFYVPYYLLWRHFDRFLSGGKDGTYSVEPPYIVDVPENYGDTSNTFTVAHNSLGDYFGLPIGTFSYENNDVRISAFPFAAYARIMKDYFIDMDNQTDENNYLSWFPDDEMEFELDDGPNYAFKTLNTSYHLDKNQPLLNLIHFANWKKDYFTSAMFSPQRGPATALPVTGTINVENQGVTKGFFNDPSFTGYVVGLFENASEAGLTLGKVSDGNIVPDANNIPEGMNNANKLRSVLNKMKITLDNNVGFSIDDLRLAVKIQEWMERNMRVAAKYNDFLRVHFNDAPLDERLTKAYYIGGNTQYLNVSQILQTSESGATPQGTPTGNATSFESGYIGKFHSHEFGLIMGVMSIMPDTSYTTGLDRHWTKRSRFDYVFPEFATLGPQDIHNYELFYNFTNQTSSTNTDAFGYIGRYDEYRHRRSLTTGSLRNSEQTYDFYSWTASREFNSLPTLNSLAFTSSNSQLGEEVIPSANLTVRQDFLPVAVGTQNPFIVQAGISVRAVRPLPYVNKPVGLV